MRLGLCTSLAAMLSALLPMGLLAQTMTGHAAKTATESQAITRQQADAILQELIAIRQLLEKQQAQRSPLAAAAVAAPSGMAQKVRLTLGDSPFLGAKDAPVVLVEFSDYQCPFCRSFQTATFPKLKRHLIDSGKLRFVSRDFPLSFHTNAARAAQAARCAGEQNRFWEMRDLLINNAEKLAFEAILDYAQQLGLKQDAFKACVAGPKYLKEIQAQTDEANALGISGTPSFVIGKMRGDVLEGVVLVGAQPYSFLEAQVHRLLAE